MSVDALQRVRQFSIVGGPNYTDDPLLLTETECAEADNVYVDGRAKTIPGGARLLEQTMSGPVVGMYHYAKSDGTAYFLAADTTGRLAYQNGSTWTTLSTAMPPDT